MALIKCPACEKEISPNAVSCPFCGEPIASKTKEQVESGVENFYVQAPNRLALTGKTQGEIEARTARLNSEGKTVVNINVSEPQLIVSLYQNNVNIIWNASLGTEKYIEFLYSQGKQFYQSRQYEKALEIFKKINGYSDSGELVSKCTEKISEEKRAKEKQDREHMEIKNAVGEDRSISPAGLIRYVVGFFCLLWGILIMCAAASSYDGLSVPEHADTFRTGCIWFAIGAICFIWNIVQHYSYKKRLDEYNAQKSKKEK